MIILMMLVKKANLHTGFLFVLLTSISIRTLFGHVINLAEGALTGLLEVRDHTIEFLLITREML